MMERLDGDLVIAKNEYFVAVAVSSPFVSREEGGHIIIKAYPDKYIYSSRLDIPMDLYVKKEELLRSVCSAYIPAMKNRGIDIVRLNYFEAGNWAWKEGGDKAHFHEHIFGRCVNSVYQKWPDAPYLPDRKTGFYDTFVGLSEEDVLEIQKYL